MCPKHWTPLPHWQLLAKLTCLCFAREPDGHVMLVYGEDIYFMLSSVCIMIVKRVSVRIFSSKHEHSRNSTRILHKWPIGIISHLVMTFEVNPDSC